MNFRSGEALDVGVVLEFLVSWFPVRTFFFLILILLVLVFFALARFLSFSGSAFAHGAHVCRRLITFAENERIQCLERGLFSGGGGVRFVIPISFSFTGEMSRSGRLFYDCVT